MKIGSQVTAVRPGILTVPSAHSQIANVEYQITRSIQGLYEAIAEADPGVASHTGPSTYTAVNVYRGRNRLGNLHEIRLGFWLWQAEFELWAVRTGNYHLRHSRRSPGDDLQFRGGLWKIRQPDGSLATCPDQLAYD